MQIIKVNSLNEGSGDWRNAPLSRPSMPFALLLAFALSFTLLLLGFR